MRAVLILDYLTVTARIAALDSLLISQFDHGNLGSGEDGARITR